MDEWMDENGWMKMDEWMDGWMDELYDISKDNYMNR